MSPHTLQITTKGEGFYQINDKVEQFVRTQQLESGILLLFCPHTSCGLTLNENYDPTAKADMENFLKHLAPRNLHFITHDSEGEDDSPAHMKSLLLQNSLSLIIEQGEIIQGRWQGIFLAEFRDQPQGRNLIVKFLKDHDN